MSKPDCDAYNSKQGTDAQDILKAEATAGNPNAIPQTLEVVAVNGTDIAGACKKAVGRQSAHACNDGSTALLNADDGPAAMSAFLVHEEQHNLGGRLAGNKSTAAGESCANKRQTLYVYGMHNQAEKSAALANRQIQDTQNPNQPGCGF